MTSTHYLYRIFIAFWIAGLLLFWDIVLINRDDSHRAPRLTAVQRAIVGHGAPSMQHRLWRYTGPRPAQGEVLRVFFRQGRGVAYKKYETFSAFLGTKDAPDLDQPYAESNTETADDFFDFLHVDLPRWNDDKELWVGLTFPPGTAVMMEEGDIELDDLEPLAYNYVLINEMGQRIEKEWFPSFSFRLVGAGEKSISELRPFVSLLVFALLLLVPIFFIGTTYRRWWMFHWAFQVVLLWKVMEVMFPSQYLWGGYYLHRIGTEVFWYGVALVQILTFPPVLDIFKKISNTLWIFLNQNWRPVFSWTLIAATAVAFYLFAISFPSRGLYGDAFGSLAVPGYDYHNPFATALYHTWRDAMAAWKESRGQTLPLSYADMRLIQIFVTYWAPLYVLAAGVLARQLGRARRESVLFFITLLLMKQVLTLIGYVEVYGPAVTLQMILLSVLIASYRKHGVIFASVFSFFAYLFHMTGALALPSVIVLWLNGFFRAENKGRWILTRGLAIFGAVLFLWAGCLFLLYKFKHNEDLNSFKNQVPALTVFEQDIHGLRMLIGSTGRPIEEVFFQLSDRYHNHYYTFGSWKHASQISGEIIFVAGPVLPWFLLGILYARRRAWRTAEFAGIVTGALLFFLFSLLLNTNYPYPKDWDVFTIHALWWTVGFLICLTRGGTLRSREARWAIASLIIYLLWDTLPWIYYNLTWGPPATGRYYIYL